MTDEPLPETIDSEEELDEFLTRPSPELVASIAGLPGPLLILGAGGKMGPTLAVRARRAAQAAGIELPVIAASRFSNPDLREWLEARDVATHAADLFDEQAVARLPEAPHVIFLVGTKFGTSSDPSLTWAVNTMIPAHAAKRFANSSIVALSTGNVYPLVPTSSPGSTENDRLTPLGEYPNAAVARERMFDYFSNRNGTNIALIRLNYALDLRYGVLVDIAERVAAAEPVDVTMGYFNSIWRRRERRDFAIAGSHRIAAPTD